MPRAQKEIMIVYGLMKINYFCGLNVFDQLLKSKLIF